MLFNNLLIPERHCFVLWQSQRAHRKVMAVKATQKSKLVYLGENPSIPYTVGYLY